MRANLRQYGLEGKYVDMMVADAAKCIWRQQELFNAIVTDRKINDSSCIGCIYEENVFVQLPMVSEKEVEELAQDQNKLNPFLQNCKQTLAIPVTFDPPPSPLCCDEALKITSQKSKLTNSPNSSST